MSPASYQTAPPRAVAAAFFLLSRVRAAALPRRAGNGTRTRDPNLGKVVLYQLSYSRVVRKIGTSLRTHKRDVREAMFSASRAELTSRFSSLRSHQLSTLDSKLSTVVMASPRAHEP